jgi:membrane protein DedA with SNARE-associated domain
MQRREITMDLNGMIVALVHSPWVLPVAFLICFLDGFFPPVPSEVVVVSVAAMSWSLGAPALLGIGLVVLLGAWCGDVFAFAIGRRFGPRLLARLRSRRLVAARSRIERGVAAAPARTLLTARFIPVGRVLANMAAGASGLPFSRFLPISLVGAALWTAVTMLLGIGSGGIFAAQPALAAVLAASLAFAGGWCVDRIVASRRRRQQKASQ